jgi:type IV pilus assembly protein PilN
MMRINLLPHREIRRKLQQQQFFIAFGIFVAIGAAIVGFVHYTLVQQFEEQQSRNAYLTEEIAKVDKQIEEINKVKEQTAALLARKNVWKRCRRTARRSCTCSTSWCGSCPTAST